MTPTKKAGTMVPFSVIDAAVHGDAEAISRVVSHYSGYIAAFAVRPSRDQNGFPCLRMDDEIRRRLEAKLILGILKFNLT